MPPKSFASNSRVLCIGYNRQLLRGLSHCLPLASVTVIEEPSIIRKRGISATDINVIDDLIACRYVDNSDALREAVARHRMQPWTAIIPGQEYATVAAADASAGCNLPGAGQLPARVLRDKRLTYALAGDLGIPIPRTAEIASARDVLGLLGDSPTGWVLKPADRQASAGVQIVYAEEDLEPAWSRASSVNEGAFESDGMKASPIIAQERIVGEEISVEALVLSGDMVFTNTTSKFTAPGSAVEIGHIVPSLRTVAAEEAVESTRFMVSKLAFDTGAIHAEWFITENGPVLIECAGRVAGDNIFELMTLAYEHDFYRSLAQVMHAQRPVFPSRHSKFAAISFLSELPVPTSRRAATTTSTSAHVDVVRRQLLTVPPDGRSHRATSSWERLGEAVVVGSNADDVLRGAAEQRTLLQADAEMVLNQSGK